MDSFDEFGPMERGDSDTEGSIASLPTRKRKRSLEEEDQEAPKRDRHQMNATMYKLVTFDHTDAIDAGQFLTEETGKIMNAKWALGCAEYHEDKISTHTHVFISSRKKERWNQEQLEDLKCLIGNPDCPYVEHVDIASSWDSFAKSQKGGVKYVLKYKAESVDGREPDELPYWTWAIDDEAMDELKGLIKGLMKEKLPKSVLVMKLVREGKDIDEISDVYPDYIMLHRGQVEKEISVWEDRQLRGNLYPFTMPDGTIVSAAPTRMEKKVSYWYASEDTASIQKSTWIEDTFEDKPVYKKRDGRYPFDGYRGEPIIICDGKEKTPSFAEIETMTEWAKIKTHVYGDCRGTGSERYLKKKQRVRYLVFTNDLAEDWMKPAFIERFHRFLWDKTTKKWKEDTRTEWDKA